MKDTSKFNTILLSFPPPVLNPNKHVNWKAKFVAKNDYKDEGYSKANNIADCFNFKDDIELDILFIPPDNRRRDLDNLLRSVKSGIDGICLALGCDDSRIKRITIQLYPKSDKPRVLFTFLPYDYSKDIMSHRFF